MKRGDALASRSEHAMSRDDEARLVARAVRGNADAFRQLVEAYKDRLFAFVWRMIRNHHEAEDICQAAFVKAYESLASYSKEYAFSTWLFTIGYRLCLNVLRKRRTISADPELIQVGASGEGVVEATANSEEARRMRKLIWNAVERLSPPQKSAVLFFYRENKSCQEIGEILGMPAVTVKSHLHRAREKLRSLLSGELVHDWLAIEFLADSGTG